jgi:hypothetical protein
MGLVNPEGYIALSLFPHLSVLSPKVERHSLELLFYTQANPVSAAMGRFRPTSGFGWHIGLLRVESLVPTRTLAPRFEPDRGSKP